MSISSRIALMEEHIGDAYDELERLGADITNTNKNIKNIGTTLNDALTLVQSVTEKGYNVTLKNTKKGSLVIEPIGNTFQQTYTGKNLLNNTATTTTVQDVTCTINPDKSITLNGSASNNGTLVIGSATLPAGSYTFSGVDGFTTDQLYLNFSGIVNVSNGEITRTLETEKTTNVSLLLREGNTYNNVTVKPMIRLSSIVDDTYEQYVRRGTKSKQRLSTDCSSCKRRK